MELDILCEVPFCTDEDKAVTQAAQSLGMTKEELIRSAVKSFCAECVPTQRSEACGAA